MIERKKRRPRDDGDAPMVVVPTTLAAMKDRSLNVRSAAKMHYIGDPKERSVEWWWKNGEVVLTHNDGAQEKIAFRDQITIDGFVKWSKVDEWISQRDQFWTDIELNVLTNLREEMTKERIDELRVMRQSRAWLTEYLFPMKDKSAPDGVRRHPPGHKFEGLPIFPLDLGNMPKFIEAYLKLDERMMLKRGEANMRIASEAEDIAAEDPESKVPSAHVELAKRVNFAPDEVRAMAKAYLLQRETSLGAVASGTQKHDDDTEEDGDESI